MPYAEGLDYAKSENYEQAIKLFEQAAVLNYPVAQMDLAITFIKQAQKIKDDSLFLSAYAWVKIAKDNKQERAEKLLSDIESIFDSRMMEVGLRKYQAAKKRVEAAK